MRPGASPLGSMAFGGRGGPRRAHVALLFVACVACGVQVSAAGRLEKALRGELYGLRLDPDDADDYAAHLRLLRDASITLVIDQRKLSPSCRSARRHAAEWMAAARGVLRIGASFSRKKGLAIVHRTLGKPLKAVLDDEGSMFLLDEEDRKYDIKETLFRPACPLSKRKPLHQEPPLHKRGVRGLPETMIEAVRLGKDKTRAVRHLIFVLTDDLDDGSAARWREAMEKLTKSSARLSPKVLVVVGIVAGQKTPKWVKESEDIPRFVVVESHVASGAQNQAGYWAAKLFLRALPVPSFVLPIAAVLSASVLVFASGVLLLCHIRGTSRGMPEAVVPESMMALQFKGG